MPRNPSKSHFFVCNHTEVDQSAACHGLRIAEKDLEAILYEIISKLAQEISAASGLNTALADALIERVDIHPGNQVDIVWKMKDFCTEGM